MSNQPNSKLTMADLMATISAKPIKISRGDEVEGKVVAITATEVVLDLGGKAEGVINKKDFLEKELSEIKVGDLLKAFVSEESESGQFILVLQRSFVKRKKGNPEILRKWQKMMQLAGQKEKISGKVIEVNKGGLLVDVNGVKGFLPTSQISLKDLPEEGFSGLVGQGIKLYVIEADMDNNRLILSTREETNQEVSEKLKSFKVGQDVGGKVAAVAPFGLIVDLGGLEGVVYSQETSWQEDVNLEEEFEVGQEIKAKVIGIDENLGRVNLSIRRLTEDPFEEIAKQFQVDDVVTGTVLEITPNGTVVQLEGGVEGFIQAPKVESGTDYQIGQKTNFLVDSIDVVKRRVNLAPFLTSTKGLIYK